MTELPGIDTRQISAHDVATLAALQAAIAQLLPPVVRADSFCPPGKILIFDRPGERRTVYCRPDMVERVQAAIDQAFAGEERPTA